MTTLTQEEILELVRRKVTLYLGSSSRAGITRNVEGSVGEFMGYIGLQYNIGTRRIPAAQVNAAVLYEMFSERLDEALSALETTRGLGNPVRASVGDLKGMFSQTKQAYAQRFRPPFSKYS